MPWIIVPTFLWANKFITILIPNLFIEDNTQKREDEKIAALVGVEQANLHSFSVHRSIINFQDSARNPVGKDGRAKMIFWLGGSLRLSEWKDSWKNRKEYDSRQLHHYRVYSGSHYTAEQTINISNANLIAKKCYKQIGNENK